MVNQFYDIKAAASRLEDILAKSMEEDRKQHIQDLVMASETAVTVQALEYPPSLRLVTNASDDGQSEADEMEFIVQAVLCGANLPPQRNLAGKSIAQLRNLRQHVKLTTFGSPQFDDAIAQLEALRLIFQEHSGDVEVLPLSFLPFEGHPCIESHARYFTDRGLVPFDKNIPFRPFVDRDGTLLAAQPDCFIHGTDNVVEYCAKQELEEGSNKYRFKVMDPSKFKAGDIVEVAFSLVAVPVQGGKYRLLLNMRSLSLIDDGIRKASERALADAVRVKNTPSPSKMKRKRVFRTEEDDADEGEREARRPRAGAGDLEVNHEGNTGQGIFGSMDVDNA